MGSNSLTSNLKHLFFIHFDFNRISVHILTERINKGCLLTFSFVGIHEYDVFLGIPRHLASCYFEQMGTCVFYLFGQQLRTLRTMLGDTRSFVCRMTLSMSLKSILGLFLPNYFSQLGFYSRAGPKNSFQCLQR